MDRLKKKIVLSDESDNAPKPNATDAPAFAPSESPAPVRSLRHAHRVIIRPVVTEKSAQFNSQNRYGFIIAREAGKQAVKRAVAELYGVEPIAVNTLNVSGKRVRAGRRSDYKKAIVTLKSGESLAVHEGV